MSTTGASTNKRHGNGVTLHFSACMLIGSVFSVVWNISTYDNVDIERGLLRSFHCMTILEIKLCLFSLAGKEEENFPWRIYNCSGVERDVGYIPLYYLLHLSCKQIIALSDTVSLVPSHKSDFLCKTFSVGNL